MQFIENDFKTIQFAAFFTDLDEDQTRVYRFLLPRLLTTHTNQLLNKTIMNEKLEDLYGAYFKSNVERIGNLSVVSIILTIVDPKIIGDTQLLDQALDLFRQVLFEHTTFDKALFLEEKRMIIEQWETLYDKKRLYAQTKFFEHFFENDAYGVPLSGSLQDIKKLTIHKIERYYHDVFLKNTKKFVANGRLDEADEKKIESIVKHDQNLKHPFVTSFRPSRSVVVIEEQTQMKQAILKLGYHFPVFRSDDLYHAAVLLDTILGGYPESRLFKEIREKQGLCYDITSTYDYYKGVIMISSGVDLKQKDHALEAIKQLVLDLINQGITEEELEHAKAYYVHQIKSSLDSQSFLTRRAFIRELFNREDTFEERLEAIQKVTLQDLSTVLNKITLDTIYVLHGGQNG